MPRFSRPATKSGCSSTSPTTLPNSSPSQFGCASLSAGPRDELGSAQVHHCLEGLLFLAHERVGQARDGIAGPPAQHILFRRLAQAQLREASLLVQLVGTAQDLQRSPILLEVKRVERVRGRPGRHRAAQDERRECTNRERKIRHREPRPPMRLASLTESAPALDWQLSACCKTERDAAAPKIEGLSAKNCLVLASGAARLGFVAVVGAVDSVQRITAVVAPTVATGHCCPAGGSLGEGACCTRLAAHLAPSSTLAGP